MKSGSIQVSHQLADDVTLNLDTNDLGDGATAGRVLTHPRHEHWTGITIGDNEPVEHLDLWLATTSNHFAKVSVAPKARERGLANPALQCPVQPYTSTATSST